MAVASRMKKSLKAQCSATNMAQFISVIHTRLTEMTLTLNGMALCSMKLRIYGPNSG